jgi:hypothetical protein
MVMRGYFTPTRFASRKSAQIWGWVGPRAGLEALDKRKISCSSQESNYDF